MEIFPTNDKKVRCIGKIVTLQYIVFVIYFFSFEKVLYQQLGNSWYSRLPIKSFIILTTYFNNQNSTILQFQNACLNFAFLWLARSRSSFRTAKTGCGVTKSIRKSSDMRPAADWFLSLSRLASSRCDQITK